MSIPLDRLYHYIESVANELHGDNVLIYRFWPHGSKNLIHLFPISFGNDWKSLRSLPQVFCYDQEPLNYDYYQPDTKLSATEYCLKHHDAIPNNLRRNCFNMYDKCILLHSELNSVNVTTYTQNNFIPVYYWSHALIALDWFRYAQHQTQIKQIKKTFLIYNRAWSGTREYRLKFMDLLIDNNLIDQCQTWHNSIEPELEIHYSQHQYINPDWAPNNQLENYITPTQATSCSSAEINLDDYNQTEFEIVLETLFDDARIQLTEKSLRPIACGQPFLIMGAPGTLKYLQKYGFKTFEGIIDESYDSINDSKNRMQAVIDTMMTIAKWTSQERKDNLDKIKKITEHNKKHFFSQKFFDQVDRELRVNLKQGLEELNQTFTGNAFFKLRKELAKNQECKQILTQPNSDRSREDIANLVSIARKRYNEYLNSINKY